MRLTNHIRDVFVKAVMQDIPNQDEDKVKTLLQDALYAAMSADVRRVYRKCPKALRTEYLNINRRGFTFIVGDADWSKIREQLPEYQAIQARVEFSRKLKATLNSFTTVKQVRDAFPELAHHLPSESKPTMSLPATSNLVADMIKLGWKPPVESVPEDK